CIQISDNNIGIYAFDDNQPFLLLNFAIQFSLNSNTIYLNDITIHGDWTNEDIQELTHLIGFIFKTTINTTQVDDVINSPRLSLNISQPIYCFDSKNTFAQACQNIDSKYSLV